MLFSIKLRTKVKVDLLDITFEVNKIVDSSGIQSGICHLFVPHTTAGIIINENADFNVVHDIMMQLNNMIPDQQGFLHGEGNSAAHIKTSLAGSSETLFIEQGKLVLGTWQGVFFCEFDGPRNRNLHIKIVPD